MLELNYDFITSLLAGDFDWAWNFDIVQKSKVWFHNFRLPLASKWIPQNLRNNTRQVGWIWSHSEIRGWRNVFYWKEFDVLVQKSYWMIILFKTLVSLEDIGWFLPVIFPPMTIICTYYMVSKMRNQSEARCIFSTARPTSRTGTSGTWTRCRWCGATKSATRKRPTTSTGLSCPNAWVQGSKKFFTERSFFFRMIVFNFDLKMWK